MADGREKVREASAQRARRTHEAWTARALKRGRQPQPYARRTAHGEVVLERLTIHEAEGQVYVEVYAAGDIQGDDPHFRIFNPPTLVEDAGGQVEAHGKRYREDPMAALAEAVARFGGAQRPRRAFRRSQG
jgi:hypothetical protein